MDPENELVGSLVQLPLNIPATIQDPVTNSMVDCWIDPRAIHVGIITNIIACEEYGEVTIFIENEFVYVPFSYISELTILENVNANSDGQCNETSL